MTPASKAAKQREGLFVGAVHLPTLVCSAAQNWPPVALTELSMVIGFPLALLKVE